MYKIQIFIAIYLLYISYIFIQYTKCFQIIFDLKREKYPYCVNGNM